MLGPVPRVFLPLAGGACNAGGWSRRDPMPFVAVGLVGSVVGPVVSRVLVAGACGARSPSPRPVSHTPHPASRVPSGSAPRHMPESLLWSGVPPRSPWKPLFPVFPARTVRHNSHEPPLTTMLWRTTIPGTIPARRRGTSRLHDTTHTHNAAERPTAWISATNGA